MTKRFQNVVIDRNTKVFKEAHNSFQYFPAKCTLMSLSVDLTTMISNKCPIIGEQVLVIFFTPLVTIATELLKTSLILACTV